MDGSGTLSLLGGVTAGTVVNYAGNAGNLVVNASNFHGTLGAFTQGSTLDLLGVTAKSAKFGKNAIILHLSSGGTLTLKTTSTETGALTVSQDGHGDTLLTYGGPGAITPTASDFLPAGLTNLSQPVAASKPESGALPHLPFALADLAGHFQHTPSFMWA